MFRMKTPVITLIVAAILSGCGAIDECKSLFTDMASAVPLASLDQTVETLYALRKGDTEIALKAQKETLVVMVVAMEAAPNQKPSLEQEKSLALAKAYLVKHPPKP
jgi:hypothetical protein